MEKNLQDKVAIVTGSARGIGKCIAEKLAARGAKVIISDIAPEEVLEQVKEEIGAEKAIVFNVCDHDQTEAVMKQIKKEFGSIDILVNNAGITRDGLMMRMSEQDFDAVINVNLKGTFNCTKHASNIMLKQRSGSIINIASVVGLMGNPGQSNYVASKAGIIGMTKANAREFGRRGVRVNAVAPGFIETDMTKVLTEEQVAGMLAQIPLQYLGQPEDIAKAVCFLASEEASYITGQVLTVDGGLYM